jgi:hypothetical protein
MIRFAKKPADFGANHISGDWQLPFGTQPAAATQATDTMYIFPLIPLKDGVISEVTIRITLGVAATEAKVGLYTREAGRTVGTLMSQPAAPLSGVVTGSASAALAASQGISADKTYWLATLVSGALQARAVSSASWLLGSILGSSTIGFVNVVGVLGYSAPQTYATGLPATLQSLTWTEVTTSLIPLVNYKVA